MRFPYVGLPTKRPVYPLGGAWVRPRPIIPVLISSALGSLALDRSIDTGSDDTLLPTFVATALGIQLTTPPDLGEAMPIGGSPITYPYGRVSVRVADGLESCEWEAVVGFTDTPLAWPLLGLAGVLQFFDAQLLGARREVVLTPNASFPGRVTQRTAAP